MESHKNQVLRITKTIFNIVPGKLVELTRNDNTLHLFKCQCLSGNYDLYDLHDKNISWGMSCETLDELRDGLLKDYLDGFIFNIKII